MQRPPKVMLSTGLAFLYGVEARVLVQAVKRNIERFPNDFMFRLTLEEARSLRSQIVILNEGSGQGEHLKYPPYAFTEQGVAMLSSVLRSRRAIQVNIAIMRAFVRLREVLARHKDLAKRFDAIESHLTRHDRRLGRHARQIRSALETIHALMERPEEPRPVIGFQP